MSKVTAFETHARRLRFQALGRACRDNRIETLLMGHHRDDNVETTLWRFCSGARGAGLTGIPQVARIPECHGIYGVSESGQFAVLKGHQRLSSSSSGGRGNRPRLRVDENKSEARMYLPPQEAANAQEEEEVVEKDTLTISTGGIHICRPLLSFPKSRLLETCKANGVPFVTDPTNFDPTLTPRNAIRSLLSSKKLPRALQPPSILSLIQRSQDLVRESTELSNRLLSACRVLEFNGRSGLMVVQFPSSSCNSQVYDASSAKADGEISRSRQIQIQAMTLRRITELISPFPENHFPLRSFEQFVDRVFPDNSDSPSMSKRQPQAFTVGGVLFRPVLDVSMQRNRNRREENNDNNDTNDNSNNNNIWLLSRQPYMRHRLPEVRFDVPIPQTQTQTPDGAEEPSSCSSSYTPWALWDNRYWFRVALVPKEHEREHAAAVQTQTQVQTVPEKDESRSRSQTTTTTTTTTTSTIPLIIRPLQPDDLQRINQSLKNHRLDDNNNINNKLSHEAPGHIRFTMPLLLAIEQQQQEQQPLALPTLDVRIPIPAGSSSSWADYGGPWTVKWQWAYKMIDPEPLKLMGWLEDLNYEQPKEATAPESRPGLFVA